MDGRATDAGRQSLPAEGGGESYASDPSACRLCGVGNPPSAHFCVNCGAILKFAGGAPRAAVAVLPVASRAGILDLPPLPAGPGASGQPSAIPAAETSAGSPTSATARPVARGERMVAWVALGVLVIAAGFFAQRIVSMSFDPAVRDAEPAITTSSAAALLATPSFAEPVVATVPAPVAVPEPPPAKVPPRVEPLVSEEASAAAAARALAPARSPVRAASPPPAQEPDPTVRETVPPPPPVAASEPPPVVAVVVPARSRWDRMHDEITACRGNFFERVGCEHGVRARYCEGWYGQAVECPSGRTADYGN